MFHQHRKCRCKQKLMSCLWEKISKLIYQHQYGELAQLGERVVRNHEVRGSIPLFSTKYAP